jgi:hypothetical protein
MVNIFHNEKIAVISLSTIFDTEKLTNDQTIDLILDISRKTSHYIILSTDIVITNILIRYKLKFIHCQIDKDSDEYIITAFKLLKQKVNLIPIIGYSNHSIQNSAGVLPMIWYNNQLYCGLGLDIKRKQYSDFGGGYDHKYTKHITNQFKNTILNDKQIKEGIIDPLILSDHFLASENKKNICRLKFIGHGDVNTKYTAFREFMEETAFLKLNGEIGYTFDMQNIYEKLYISKSFILLGGDALYGYDMYLIFMTPDDLLPEIKLKFLKSVDKKINNKINNKINTSCDPDIPIIGNNEMFGIDIISLNFLITNKHILTSMRPCFANAIVRYTKELQFIDNHYRNINNLFI